MSVKICVLTQEESDTWSNSGIRPDCRGHRHVALSTAIRWHDYPRYNCLIRAEWAGKYAIMVEREESPMMWITAHVGRGEFAGPGLSVRQLVRGPAPIVASGKHYEGIVPVGGKHGLSRTMVRDNNFIPMKAVKNEQWAKQ